MLLAGAGGAARAIAFALAGAGCARLTVANRTASKAEDLADRVRRAFPGWEAVAAPADPSGHDLIVNATSLRLRPTIRCRRMWSGCVQKMTVAEVVMKPEQTALLATAKARGCRLHLGRRMLDAQVRLLADFLGACGEESGKVGGAAGGSATAGEPDASWEEAMKAKHLGLAFGLLAAAGLTVESAQAEPLKIGIIESLSGSQISAGARLFASWSTQFAHILPGE